jgi:hypothetical protein
MRSLIALAGLALAMTACGSGGDSGVAQQSATRDASPTDNSPSSSSKAGTLVKTGFGQQDEYVWATSLVRNDSDHAGQTVVVSFNLKDKSGKVVATGSQTSAFNWPGQEVPVGTQVEAPKHVKVASVEATLDVEDAGAFDDEVSDNLDSYDAVIAKGEYGGWSATYHVKNPTDQAMKGTALQEICMNTKGDIIGGTSEYPDLIPPSGEIVVKSDNLYLSEKPASCKGYLTPWM